MTRYAVWIDDHETRVMPLDGLDVIEIEDDQIEALLELESENATLAEIEAALGVTAGPLPA